jgi:hypothetical protein
VQHCPRCGRQHDEPVVVRANKARRLCRCRSVLTWASSGLIKLANAVEAKDFMGRYKKLRPKERHANVSVLRETETSASAAAHAAG